MKREPRLPKPGTALTLLLAMQRGERLTMLTAFHKYGTTCASQRINELERIYGFHIVREWLTLPSGKRVRSYSLERK